MKTKAMGKIRIIGGIHRSRQLPVLDSEDLRPTLDRVKETVFNWLGQDLTGKSCLDLFAGSGSLGFEALSRNAKEVVMVEKMPRVARQLSGNCQLLKVTNCQVLVADAQSFLSQANKKFDVIFLDPPYNSDLLTQVLKIIINYLTADGICYIEYETAPNLDEFSVIKNAKAGKVQYALIRPKVLEET